MTKTILIPLLLLGCVAPQPVLETPKGDDVTIFLHGYRASFLATEDGSLAYVTPGAAFSKGEKSLALEFEGQRAFPRFGPLHTTGPLTTLTVLPFIVEENPYGTFMQWAKSALPGFQVYAYDWRQDVRENAKGLCAFIEKLGPGKKVRLIGHSMGGLVSLACLRTGSDAVRAAVVKVAFVGTPFRGAPTAWDDLQLGTSTGSNTTLLNTEALLTFPAVWQLLPNEPNFFVDAQSARVDVGGYQAQTWIDRGWGLFAESAVRENAAYRKQLEQRLAERAALAALLADEAGPAPSWKALAIVGKGRSTIETWRALADGGVDLKDPVRGDGDETVRAVDALPPKPIEPTVVEVKSAHSELLNDDAVRQALRVFVE